MTIAAAQVMEMRTEGAFLSSMGAAVSMRDLDHAIRLLHHKLTVIKAVMLMLHRHARLPWRLLLSESATFAHAHSHQPCMSFSVARLPAPKTRSLLLASA